MINIIMLVSCRRCVVRYCLEKYYSERNYDVGDSLRGDMIGSIIIARDVI